MSGSIPTETTASAHAPAVNDSASAVASGPRVTPFAPSAVRDLGSHLRFWLVAACGLALDLWSKNWAFGTLTRGEERVIVPNVLEFTIIVNDGALFGIGKGQTTLFLIASMLALLLVWWMFVQSSPRRWALQIALGGILAGALGNMYDRATVKLVEGPNGRLYEKLREDAQAVYLREFPPGNRSAREIRVPIRGDGQSPVGPERGYVRDFIKIVHHFRKKPTWPWVFNVADMLLVGGVGILAIHLWRDRKPPAPAPSPAVDAAGAAE